VENAVAIERAAKIVRARLPEQPVVIVSALAGVTDQLVALGEAASLGKHAVVVEILVDLRARHYETARKLLKDVSLSEPILAFASMFEELESHINQVLATAELSPESSPEKSPELSADSSRPLRMALPPPWAEAAPTTPPRSSAPSLMPNALRSGLTSTAS